jgi:hypothetical protein
MWIMTARKMEAVLTAKAELDFVAAERVFPGSAVRRFGRVVATRLPALPDLIPYNKARAYSPDDQHAFVDIAAYYAETGQRPSVEVWAEDATADLHLALLAHGLAPSAPTVTLHAHLSEAATEPAPHVDVREIGRDDPRYLSVLLSGYGAPPDDADLRRMIAIEHQTPGLRRYLATIDGEPAAAAALFTHNNVSLFAGAATLPRFRHRGCQTALITRRLLDAASDSDTAVATAAFASPSHSNLARLGFQITHTRTVWVQPTGPQQPVDSRRR